MSSTNQLCINIFAMFALMTCAALSKPLSFDFGPTGQETAEGFEAVSGRTVYSPELGYGWETQWGMDFARENVADQLSRDGIVARRHDYEPDRKAVFKADIENGIYEVHLWVGDPAPREGRKGICITINGKAVLPPPGTGGWGMVSEPQLPVVVKNGRLRVKFSVFGDGGAYRLSVLAMSVRKVTDPAKLDQLQLAWDKCADASSLETRTIEVGGKSYIEVGRHPEPEEFIAPAGFDLRVPLVFFKRRNPGDILDYSVPNPEDLTEELTLFGTPSATEPLSFGVYALQNLHDVRVGCSDLSTDSGTRIPRESVEIFTVTCLPQSPTESVGGAAVIAPELLEKKIPFELDQGLTQPLFVRIRIPAEQQAGIYSGYLQISPAGHENVQIPVRLNVLPLNLSEPPDKIWHLYSDSGRWIQMSEIEIQREIKDMAEHGINSLKLGYPPVGAAYVEENGHLVDVDYGRIGEGIRYAAEMGMDGPLVVSSTAGIAPRFRGWSIGHRGGAGKHSFVEGVTGRALSIEHAEPGARTECNQIVGTPLPPGTPVRLEIRYRVNGQGSGSCALVFMESYKRNPVKEGRISIPLRGTDDTWQTAYATSSVPENAVYARTGINWGGGPGILQIDHVSLLDASGTINHVVNPGMERDFGRVDLNQPWPETFMNGYIEAVQAIGRAAKRLGFSCYIEGTDEAGNNPSQEVREINELKGAKLAGYRTWCNLAPHMVPKVAEYLDAVCFYSSMLGNEEECHKLIAAEHQAGREVYTISSGTYEGQDCDMMPNRYGVGFFFWKSGLDGTGIWTFQRTTNDPFNDFDSQYRDHCLVYPPREKGGRPIPTIAWEGIREGWKDYCYAYTLEEAVLAAEKEGLQDQTEFGNMVLELIRDAVPWENEYNPLYFDNQSADELRWLTAWTLMNLRGKLPTASDSAPAVKPQLTLQFDKRDAEKEKAAVVGCPGNVSDFLIDGEVNEKAWDQARHIDNFEAYKMPGMAARFKTELLLAHDAEALYLGFRCYEPEMDKIRASASERDGNVFADDSIEIFLDTNNDAFSYYQLAFNLNGARFDQECAGGYNFGDNIFKAAYGRKKVRNPAWNGDWQVRTSRHADRWEAEVVIPFKSVGRESDLWGAHFGRNRRTGEGETSSWKAIGFFNQPDKFSKLLLTGSRVADQQIQDWLFEEPRHGLNKVKLALDVGQKLQVLTNVLEANGRTQAFAASIDERDSSIEYELTALSEDVVHEIRNAEGALLYRFEREISVPELLNMTASRQVFMPGRSRGAVRGSIGLSSHNLKNAELIYRISRGAEVVFEQKVVPEAEVFNLECDLKDVQQGFYKLQLRLRNVENDENLAEQIIPMAVAPHYMQN